MAEMWSFALAYDDEKTELQLYALKARYVLLRESAFILLWIPGGYRLWSRIVLYVDTKERKVFDIELASEHVDILAAELGFDEGGDDDE